MAKLVKLYDEDGNRVGTYCIETGRAQIGMNFFVVERTCHLVMSEYGLWTCDKCGLPVEFDSIYCPECGAKVVD